MPRSFQLAARGRNSSAGRTDEVRARAESESIRECLQWFSRERQWIAERHVELCRIPAPTFQEEKRAAWMAEQFRQLDYEVKLDRAGNVLAIEQDSGELPLVALTAHLDTVLAPRRPSDICFGPDGRLTGPGVSDNGAGLTALLAVARAFREHSIGGDRRAALAFVANVGEEGEGNLSGMRFLCRPAGFAAKVRAFLVLDGPSLDHITSQALASRRYEVSFSGPGGHSWSDYGVGNPVHALSHSIASFVEGRMNGGGGQRSSFNFGTIEGGLSINSIPTQARAKLDLRSELPGAIDEMAAELGEAVERALETENQRASGGKVSAKIREIGSRPGGRLPEDSALLRHLLAVDAYLGIRAQPDCASTDANIPLSLGLPAISIGAGGQGGGAHTPQEWYSPEGRELGLKRILLTLALLIGDPDGSTVAR